MRKYNGWTIIHGTLLTVLLTACANRPAEHQAYAGDPPPQEAPTTAPEPVSEPAVPAPVRMREDAPLHYVVKKGDTLWDIANHFLKQPWQWPEIWYVNDHVRNPHLIFPGDVLTLMWRDGRPMLQASDNLSANTEYLSPRVREVPLEQAIPTIPLETIRDFLRTPRLVDAEELRDAPYVLSFVDPHIVEGTGSLVYLQKLPNGGASHWDTIRLGQKFVDPDTGEMLGWEGTPVGSVDVREFGSPATAIISDSTRETLPGDRLIKPLDDSFNANFYPHAPDHAVGGRILSVYDGVSQIGQYQVVTLNRGTREGIEPGHVLSILQANRTARDPYTNRLVTLPPLYAGTLMVFKVEKRVSYALVLSATREIHVLDRVEKPKDGEQS
ncbi:LysM peptidoglycan-binding domain-containing protein [Solimonas terrae]|uniref:LysM peptidoglycan-binding domain-containing protein n=1 Tax=Solimonas terrae TaxID=1396819 RepID=A0A6M2BR89_9GAMM|nr:LysM peptidoglycan-binding domain-containing protein [Solimonas terrae]NGY04755.1 LysM peptidoglycan-binding domain-containing protein [Solimonas terrae]